MKRLILAMAALGLAACATTPTPHERADSGVITAAGEQYRLPGPNTGAVTITRDSGITGSACTTRIYLGGNQVADIRAGQAITLHLPAGAHVVGVDVTGICGGSMEETEVRVDAGQTRNYRIKAGGMNERGGFRLMPTQF